MGIKSWVRLLFFFALTIQLTDIQAQKISKNIKIKWKEPLIYEQDAEEKMKLLYFEGSISDAFFENLPSYYEYWKAEKAYSTYDVTISDERYEGMTADEIALIPENYLPTDIQISVQTVIEKKQPYTALTFIPIRKRGNGYERLVSATISIMGQEVSKTAKTAKSYAASSILKNGNWYKISVTQSGMFKVTHNDLVNLGFSTGSVPSERISLFGNGGGMLPESNAKERYDDLWEVAIEMHDGGDGTFDSGDYFIFYAEGPHSWKYNASEQKFEHQYNLYDTKAYYFINADAGIGEGLRVSTQESPTQAPTSTVTTYTAYGFYEKDLYNIGSSGRGWYCEKFDGNTSSSYSLTLPASVNGPGRLTAAFASSSIQHSTFAISANGQSVGSVGISAITHDKLAEIGSRDLTMPAIQGNASITIEYSKPTSSSVGYLNYLEWQMPCDLRMESGQTAFCAPQAVAEGSVARYQIANATQSTKVWDVTVRSRAEKISTAFEGSTLSFNAAEDILHKYVAFNDNNCYAVTTEGRVSNQDLHGGSQVDMVIITHPDFKAQAERLASFRRQHDGLTVKVVTPQQVYNEFSSGAQDVTAIRDYMRMIYEKSGGSQPSYLLLVGRPSYDYRGIEGSCKLYVPNYQGESALANDAFRANDDYFALLDSNEGAGCTGHLDLAVGRFPVTTATQAKIAVDKTIRYCSEEIQGAGTQVCNYGDWKNIAAFTADDEDGITHIGTADAIAEIAGNSNANINLEKIYLDAYHQVTYSSSARYPEVTRDINNRINKGCLLFTYVGHGGKNGWAAERIIELTDISNWSNRYNLPWIITLTCEFGWYDRQITSPAEMVFLNENGGAAGMITTSRVAFTGSNHTYGTKLYNKVFELESDRPHTIGELNRMAKNASGGASNTLNMIYVMGDPAMRLAIPKYQVVTDSINGVVSTEFRDTLKALSRVTISGHIADADGALLSGFNGGLYPSFYDKKQTNNTLQNDEESDYFEFQVQKNILFKGNITVRDGRFNFTFILPKDINYSYGKGKMSYYAHSSTSDAAGAFSDAIVGGMSENGISDDSGPEIELYMNDENFVNGGIVNPSPTLLVKLRDEYGINTTGNGIGHDLVAIIDDGEQTVLNSYYEAERDSSNRGVVRYPYEKLSIGTHRLKVRAWDILNNVSEQEIEFTVASDEGLTLSHVLNYPNPFTTSTDFYFEHNQPGATLDILITIYTISGKVVKTIESTQCNQGFRSDPIHWDGRDDFGDKIGKGTYLYRLKVRGSDGQQAEKIEKIVLL